MQPAEYPLWVWILFFSIVLAALFVDIGIVNRKSHEPSRKETFTWSVVWVSLALAFNGFVFYQFGVSQAKLFLTGYIIELSLSVDNLFVFLLIFTFFKVPKKYQHRVLFWGIMGALFMRMAMIFAGAELVEGDDTIALVGETGMRLAQVIAGQTRPAVQAENRLAAGSEAVGNHAIAIDIDLESLVWLHFTPH